MNYKFCIMAAGKGTRNKTIKGLHKALLPIENETVISRIIKRLPKFVEIVIAVGYKSEQIKTYVSLVHSDRNITYVDIENYEDMGSGPGLSLLCCEKHLQCPFIFTSVDTLVEESYGMNDITNNWVGYSVVKKTESSSYCLVKGEKTLEKFYYGNGDKAFIGMAGVYDYYKFWEGLKNKPLIKNEYQVIHGFELLNDIELKYFNWHDTGNEHSYEKTRNKYCNEIAALKNDEALFIEHDIVIKYFFDSKMVDNRIERGYYLNGTIPTVFKLNDNMYYYKYLQGKTISAVYDVNILKEIVPYWYKRLGSERFDKTNEFINDCKDMYHGKTVQRCEYFNDTDVDNVKYINGVKVDTITNMLNEVNWDSIYETAIPSKFHGDFQPENIIYDDNKFTLIDWRQSFGENLKIGDFYYDLGKMYHALFLNGKDINDKMYYYSIDDNNAYLFYHSRSNLMILLDELKNFVEINGYSWKNVELLGALQYLGISSLYQNFHNGEYGEFLFLHGKYLLSKIINKNKK